MSLQNNNTNFQRTAKLLEASGKLAVDTSLSIQFGRHLEAMCDQLDQVLIAGSSSDNGHLEASSTRLKGIAHRLKTGRVGIRITNREKLLAALCAAEIGANAVAYLAGMNKPEADRRVLFLNDTNGLEPKPGSIKPHLGDCI